jgi:hypothetical protein
LVNCEPASILNLASMFRSASSETDFWFSNRFENDAERNMLAKFRIEAGSQFTKAAEGMMKDVKVSEILNLASMFRSASSETDFWFSNRFERCWQ